jgi:hypothetical protein
MPEDDYMARLEEARDLIQLAGGTAEGRAAARSWLRQVISAVGDAEPEVLQPVPPELVGTGYVVNRNAMRRAGYDATTIALSETGGAGIELYPDPGAAGPYDSDDYPGPGPAWDGGTAVQYDNAALEQALVLDNAALEQELARDEVDRYSLMLDGRRPGPARPQYAGLQLSQPRPAGEADPDDIVTATMELAARAGERVSFRDVAEAVDELALSRGGETGARADAVVSLARRYFPDRGSPATADLDLELARQREIDRLTRGHGRRGLSDRIARRQGAEPDEAEAAEEEVDRIVADHRDMLTHEPARRGLTHLSTDDDYDKYAEQNDARQPSRGGVLHPEAERIARENGHYFQGANKTYPVPTAAERERQERRARAGTRAACSPSSSCTARPCGRPPAPGGEEVTAAAPEGFAGRSGQGSAGGYPPAAPCPVCRVVSETGAWWAGEMAADRLRVYYQEEVTDAEIEDLEAWEEGYAERLEVRPCEDCGTDTSVSEVFELRGEVWTSAGMDLEGYLCVGCCERRLGRRLVRADFDQELISVRLAERMADTSVPGQSAGTTRT